MFNDSRRWLWGSLLTSALIVASSAQAQERRGRWDPSGFLQRLDRNQNGVLEPDELSDRSRGFIENLGLATGEPVPIQQVIDKINRDRQEADSQIAQPEQGKTSSTEWNSPGSSLASVKRPR